MSTPPSQSSDHDPFDTLLTLEDTLYTTAYTAGLTDGSRAGRIEGRVFGLEKGFEKYSALGALHGRSVVWGSRIHSSSNSPSNLASTPATLSPTSTAQTIPFLPPNPRLRTNILLFHGLTDPLTFSTENTEDSVADFDDRVKRAGAKAKVIERMAGEHEGGSDVEASSARGKVGPTRIVGGRGKRKDKGDESIEDFAGSRLLR